MNNQPIIFSKDITTGDINPLVSANNVLLTSRPNLNQLTNVEITTPTNNQVLTYDAAGDLWYNADSQGGGGGATTLAGLTDVAITTPTNGQYLQYDTSLAIPKWVNKTPQYLSYSVNAYPLNTLFTTNSNFSMFATSSFNTSPTPVINYNFPNNIAISPITLSTDTGLITGLDAAKIYMIDLSMMKTGFNTTSNGVHTMSLLNGVEGALIVSSNMRNSSTGASAQGCFTMLLHTIITGQTQVYPVLRTSIPGYAGRTDIDGYNVQINIREL